MTKNAKTKDEASEGSSEETGEQAIPAQEAGAGVLVKSEKEVLLELYQTLKDLGINSIGDLEVRISRL